MSGKELSFPNGLRKGRRSRSLSSLHDAVAIFSRRSSHTCTAECIRGSGRVRVGIRDADANKQRPQPPQRKGSHASR